MRSNEAKNEWQEKKEKKKSVDQIESDMRSIS
jgi:hypothetical protein